MTDKGAAVREIILDILMEVLEKKQYSHLVLSKALNKYQYLEKQDRSFIKRVVDGTIEYQLQIDYILDAYSKVKTHKMKPVVRTILRMAVYQICHMDRVPDSAACNEAVRLAKKRGFQNLTGFVNGVLRNVSRGKETLSFPDLSIRYSMPEWITGMWEKDYGRETTERILKGLLEDRPLTARCNHSLASTEEIISSLKAQSVTAEPSAKSGDVLNLSGVDYLEGLLAFQNGWIQIQDLSSCLAGDAAGVKKGDFVLDVCGAPGGKSLHIADLLSGTGTVVVRDISEEKIALVRETIARAGFTNMRAEAYDALVFDHALAQRADVVIADLPCSGLGVIGRKPDIKYNMTLQKAEELASLQQKILSVVSGYVKPGGAIVYSTCTIHREENEKNMEWFLRNYPFEPVDISGRIPPFPFAGSMRQGYIQLLPGIHPCDGFFISVMKRKEIQ